MYIVYFLNSEKVGNLTLLNSFTTNESAKSSAVETYSKFIEKDVQPIDEGKAEDIRCDAKKQDGLYAIYDRENSVHRIYEKTSAAGMIFTSYYIKELGLLGVTPSPSHRASTLSTKQSAGKWMFVDQITKLIKDADSGKKEDSVILPSQLCKKKLGSIKRNSYCDSSSESDTDTDYYSTDDEMEDKMKRWVKANDQYEQAYVEYCKNC